MNHFFKIIAVAYVLFDANVVQASQNQNDCFSPFNSFLSSCATHSQTKAVPLSTKHQRPDQICITPEQSQKISTKQKQWSNSVVFTPNQNLYSSNLYDSQETDSPSFYSNNLCDSQETDSPSQNRNNVPKANHPRPDKVGDQQEQWPDSVFKTNVVRSCINHQTGQTINTATYLSQSLQYIEGKAQLFWYAQQITTIKNSSGQTRQTNNVATCFCQPHTLLEFGF